MDAWQERLYRRDAITEGFIRPQAQEMALALEDSRNVLHSLNLNPINQRGAPTNPDQIIKHVEPRIRLMAIQDQYDSVPCEAPLMMWDHYTTSVRLRKLINALYVAASPNSNQKAIQTLRDENVTYWGDDIIVL